MIEIRGTGRPFVIGHRGAAALAPENTIAGFRAGVELGCDLIEFDVLDLDDGTLVVAHSDDLAEVSHGRAVGTVRDRSLADLRRVAPLVPTLEDALAYFADEGRVGLHVDLKLRRPGSAARVAAALATHGLVERAVVSSPARRDLVCVGGAEPALRLGHTYPDDRLGLAGRPLLRPAVEAGLVAMRAAAPWRVVGLGRSSRAQALMVQYRVVSSGLVARAHARGLAVVAWTVDDPEVVERMRRCRVDGIVSNDPRLLL